MDTNSQITFLKELINKCYIPTKIKVWVAIYLKPDQPYQKILGHEVTVDIAEYCSLEEENFCGMNVIPVIYKFK
jgi:hypothetical protein